MFAAKSTIFLAFLAVAAQVVAAGNPACMLGAINSQPDPSDMSAVCGSNASKVQTQIQSICGANAAAAQKAFISACSDAGKTVPAYSSSAAASTATGSSSGSSATGFATATTATSTNGSGNSTSTSSTGAPNPSKNAASNVQVGSFAALLFGAAGVVMAL